jgi:hypothetical protein
MHKRGMTIVELLGALVLFGIIISLSAVMISVITNANAKIVEQSRANTEGTLLTALIDRKIREFGPTNYTTCIETDCIVLVKTFEYVPNLELGTINLVVYNPVQTLKIEVSSEQLLINNEVQSIAHFTIDPTSSIIYSINGRILTYEITIIFVGEHDHYTFHYNKNLELLDIPT